MRLNPSDLWFDPAVCQIGGADIQAAAGTLDLSNPSDGSVLTQIARGGTAEIDQAVAAAQKALDGPWGRLSAAERGRLLAKLGRLVETRIEELARLEAP